MTHTIFTAAVLAAFALFLAWAGDNLAGPHVQPIDAGLVDMAEAAQLVESELRSDP
ncbi:MAG: hypothetical protein ACR2P3_10070 [Geminicoccaceae bacterium]